MQVSICMLTRGDPRVESMGSLFAVKDDPRLSYMDIRPTLYLHHGREEGVRDFMAHPERGDWLLFIDDDMQFTPSALDQLLTVADPDKAPICGGVYWSPRNGDKDHPFPIVMSHQAGDPDSHMKDTWVHTPFPVKWTAQQTAPFYCDAIGTGFLLIHRSVLATMAAHYEGPLHWFNFDIIEGVTAGEDLTFCYRAKQIGYNIVAVPFTDPNDLIHVKLVKIGRPNV